MKPAPRPFKNKSSPQLTPGQSEIELTTAGQRHINLLWETTQSKIALFTVFSNITLNAGVIIFLNLYHKEITATAITVIQAALGSMNTTTGIIIGFYFSRTNHTAKGGVGVNKPLDER